MDEKFTYRAYTDKELVELKILTPRADQNRHRLIKQLMKTREENERLRDQVDDLEDYVSTLEEDIKNLETND